MSTNGDFVNNEWGLREFAYPIKKETKGYYVVIKIEADNVALNEFDRITRFDNNVLRTLVTVDHQ